MLNRIINAGVEKYRNGVRQKKTAELRKSILFRYYEIERNRLEIELAEEELRSIGYKEELKIINDENCEEKEKQERAYSETDNGEAVQNKGIYQ